MFCKTVNTFPDMNEAVVISASMLIKPLQRAHSASVAEKYKGLSNTILAALFCST